MKIQRTARLAALIALAGIAAFIPDAKADRASGSWTGELQLRGNYYWERSTRVVAPSLSGGVVSPDGLRIGGEYLVDSITSASQAAGVLEDVRFTEIRHQGSINAGYEFDLGEAHLDISGSLRVSREPDYLSIGGGFGAALSLAERTTILRVGLSYVHDEIRQNFQTGTGEVPDQAGGMSGSIFRENFDAVALTVGWEQILSPVVYFQVTYQYGYMDGFLANAYRRVVVNDALRAENHPGVRRRHTVTGRLAYHLRATGTSFHLIYRAYYDSWNIGALTPEVRIYQRLARYAFARVRWRHYRQTKSFFYEDAYPMDTTDDAFVTADPKMSEFHSNLLGFQLLLKAGFLDGTRLEGLRGASIDLSFDYIWNTNRFGNGVIAEAGLRVPF